VTICGIRHAILAVDHEVSAGPSTPDWRLTPTEAQLAADLLDGASNAELARRRRRSINTVRNQLAALYRKLGVTSRREAIVVLLQSRRADQRISSG
jgi:DNA-binding CsgD family transcriptional regulator